MTVCIALMVPTSWLAKLTLATDDFAAAPTPVPTSGTDCDPPGRLPAATITPVRVPGCVGVKVTLTAQLPPGVTADGTNGWLTKGT